ncbi:ester cyclase [Microbacterium sp. NPDC089695]|uniref:ester cyclase n=1 Tax=Microbacterium sp. NPDC089695 TaxID=3364198 RepID=UPI0038075234
MELDPVAYRPYADPDDFIREVTDRIWVERDIRHIEENYEPDSIVHNGYGTITTRDEVIIGSTMRSAVNAANPGAQPAQAEDVVWEARGADAFLSSHLILRAEERLVDQRWTRVQVHSVANCLYRRGRMVEEWIARDGLAAVLQTGGDPETEARAKPFRGYVGSFLDPAPADVLAHGDSGERPDDHRDACELVLNLIDTVWNGHDFRAVNELMVRDLFLHSSGAATYIRPQGYQRETLRLLSAFPTARFEVRDIQVHDSVPHGGIRVAAMWKMTGRYDGQPDFGAVTGSDVDLLGVSHFLVHDGRVLRERRIVDEIALRSQINAARGDEPVPDANIYF